jgi:hypothetical protein
MKRISLLQILAALILAAAAGCQSPQSCPGYKSTASIVVGPEKDTYVVNVNLSELPADGRNERVLTAPRVTVKAGEPAVIQATDRQQDGFIVTAFVPERRPGATAKCSVHFRKNGRTLYLSTFELTLPYD